MKRTSENVNNIGPWISFEFSVCEISTRVRKITKRLPEMNHRYDEGSKQK